MTKYEELCEAADTTLKDWRQYKKDCAKFISALASGLQAYLEYPWPIAVTPPEEELKGKLLVGNIYFRVDSTFCRSILIVKLPRMNLEVELDYKKNNDLYIVKFGDKEFKVKTAEECVDLYEFIVQHYKNRLNNHLSLFLKQDKSAKQIAGFNIQENE